MHIIKLEENYRSTQPILTLTNEILHATGMSNRYARMTTKTRSHGEESGWDMLFLLRLRNWPQRWWIQHSKCTRHFNRAP